MKEMLSLIILNYNKAAYSRRCLESLLATDYRPLEIIAVDNGSTDETPQVLQSMASAFAKRGILFEVITFDDNRGAIEGRNAGIAAAAGEWLAFLDNDVAALSGNWWQPLLEALRLDPGTGITGPRLLFPEPPHNIECAGCEVTRDGRVIYRGRGEARHDPRFADVLEVQALISACIMLRRSLLDEVGRFDEVFSPVQFEDIDLCYRARSAGYRVLFIPQAELFHYEGVTTDGSVDLNFAYLTVRNGLIFKNRWRHMFAGESGPEGAPGWRNLQRPRLEKSEQAGKDNGG